MKHSVSLNRSEFDKLNTLREEMLDLSQQFSALVREIVGATSIRGAITVNELHVDTANDIYELVVDVQ